MGREGEKIIVIGQLTLLMVAGGMMVLIFVGITLFSGFYSLNGIKNRAVGDGQYGTARFALKKKSANALPKSSMNPQYGGKGRIFQRRRG